MANITSRVVEVCVFKKVHHKPRYLLVKRADDDTLYPGIWQLVTGMVERDEHAVRAALRELREETQLQPQRVWVVPYVDIFYSAATDSINLCPLFAVEVKETDEPKLSHEHQAYGWCTLAEAKKRLVWHGQKEGLQRADQYIVGGLEGGKLTEVKDFSSFERNAP